MSLDLKKLENKLDEALSNETSETLNKFLTDKTMSNNKQSSIEWLEQELKKIPFVNVLEVFEQAKAMHKEEIKKSYTTGFGANLYQAENYYNETFGGNK